MDIKKLSVTELKAMGFDFQNQIDIARQNLSVILTEIEARKVAPPVEVKPE